MSAPDVIVVGSGNGGGTRVGDQLLERIDAGAPRREAAHVT